MDSATPPSDGAQNDSMVGGVLASYRKNGGFSPFLVKQILLNCRYLSVHRTKTGVRVCVFVLFPPHFARVSGLAHEAAFIHKISIQLLTPENLF